MSEEENDLIEIEADSWFAICDAKDSIQAIFPNENDAVWYLEKYGWTNWKIRRVSVKENLFLSEQQHSGADNNEN